MSSSEMRGSLRFPLHLFLFSLLGLLVPVAPFECMQLEAKHNWATIYKQCLPEKEIGPSDKDQVILELSKEPQEDLIEFFKNKVTIKVGIVITRAKGELLSLRFPELQTIDIEFDSGKFIISDNPHLRTIDFDKLQTVTVKNGPFIIGGNRNLETIKLPAGPVGGSILELKIYGNNKLMQANVDQVHGFFKNYKDYHYHHLQGEGECHFENDHHIANANELDYCKYISGDLVFAANAIGTTRTKKLAKVDGCVDIINTKLKSLAFLNNTDIKCVATSIIRGNELLEECNTLQIQRKQNMIMENNCQATCMPGEVLVSEKTCSLVKEGIRINRTNKLFQYERLRKVREVHGPISIIGTLVKDLNWLSKLEVLYDPEAQEPMINITGNKALKTLDLHNLKNISSSSRILIVVKNNGNYAMADDLYDKLVAVAGGRKEALEIDTLKELKKKKMEEAKDKKAEEEEKEQEDKTTAIAIGVGVSAGVGILLIIAVVVVVVVVLKRKKKSKNEKKDNKNNKTNDKEKGNKVKPIGSVMEGAKKLETGEEKSGVSAVVTKTYKSEKAAKELQSSKVSVATSTRNA